MKGVGVARVVGLEAGRGFDGGALGGGDEAAKGGRDKEPRCSPERRRRLGVWDVVVVVVAVLRA